MFQGSGFAIPGLLVAFLTIGIGGIGVFAGWLSIVGNDQSKTSLTTIPYALYSLALSVAVQVSGLLLTHYLNHQSYDLAQRPVFGTRLVVLVFESFLLANLALCLTSWLLARRASGPAASLLRKSSTALLVTWGLGFVLYLAGE